LEIYREPVRVDDEYDELYPVVLLLAGLRSDVEIGGYGSGDWQRES